tara:strand:- start:22956 stop:24626 length:1671 start_codon:yes stop_codon:yes gene_type:complete
VSPVSAIAQTPDTTANDSEALSAMPGVAWVVGNRGAIGMTITDPDAHKRLRRDELSASTAFGLDPSNCAVGVVASRLIKRNDGLFEANQLGTAAHAVLEYLFGLDKPLRTEAEAVATVRRLHTDQEFALRFVDKGLSDQIAALEDDELARWYAEVDRRALGLWGIEDPTAVNVHSTEMAFGKRFDRVVKIGRVPFVGFIDRVDKIIDPATGETTGYVVKDYKAGKVKHADRYGDDYGDQIRIYKVAVREAEGIDPEGGSLLFIAYGVEREVETDEESVAITIARFERAWDRMHELADANYYPAKDGPLCGWCPLVNSCPSAAKNGRKDLSDTEKVSGKRVVVEGKPKQGIPAVDLGIPIVGAPHVFEAAAEEVQQAEPAIAPVAVDAAHRSVEPNKENNMTATATATVRVKEGMNRSETHVETSLNGNSFAAIAAFDFTERAVSELAKAGQAVTPAAVKGLAHTYAIIVQTIQAELANSQSYSEGINCRIRSALATSIDTIPAPWQQPLEQWNAWAESVTKRTRAISNVALALVTLGSEIPASPWAALSTEGQTAA